jgi:hypothetical protein
MGKIARRSADDSHAAASDLAHAECKRVGIAHTQEVRM